MSSPVPSPVPSVSPSTRDHASPAEPSVGVVDARGQRFAAAVTAVVLAVVLLTGSVWLLAVQTAVFALGALVGPRATPYALVFRRLVQPRLSGRPETEDARPPRFAQAVGLAFSLVGLLALVVGLDLVGLVAVGLALVAALLNAATGLCLGCELYLVLRRARA